MKKSTKNKIPTNPVNKKRTGDKPVLVEGDKKKFDQLLTDSVLGVSKKK